MSKKTIIYGLYSSRKPDELRYVGQTTQTLQTRFKQHKSYAKTKKTAVHKWFNREVCDGFEILIVVIRDDAIFNVTEREVIALHKENGARLLNLTDGGEGTLGWHGHAGKPKPYMAEVNRKRCLGKPGHPMSPENKAKLIAAVKARDTTYLSERNRTNHPWKGRKHTEETKRKQSLSGMGRVVSEEARKKISIANTGKKRTPEQIEKLRAGHMAYYASLKKHGSQEII